MPKLADRARAEEWSYERFAQALLATEQSSREAHGDEGRIRAARFPARKTLEEFDFTFQRTVKKQVIEHLGQLDFLHERSNIVALGPPGTGKTHLAVALAIRACLAGQRVLFRTATEWVALLADAQRHGHLNDELRRLERYPLLVCDEVGYIPFDPQAANLMFMLVSRRYERASLIVTSNKPFSAWGEIFGDDATAAAMIDRLVHHAEILSLKGNSYRLKDHDLEFPRSGRSRPPSNPARLTAPFLIGLVMGQGALIPMLEAQASWVAAVLADQLVLPSTEVMRASIARDDDVRRRDFDPRWGAVAQPPTALGMSLVTSPRGPST